jgi:hypothetical protein
MRFGGKEAKSATIDLPVDDPALIKLLVQYLYHADYNPLVFPGDDALRDTCLEVKNKPRYLGPREIT